MGTAALGMLGFMLGFPFVVRYLPLLWYGATAPRSLTRNLLSFGRGFWSLGCRAQGLGFRD